MSDQAASLDLTFPSLEYGEMETPLDLLQLLYQGGARLSIREAPEFLARDDVQKHFCADRVDLVRALHHELNAALVGGGSRESLRHSIQLLRGFFSWAEEEAIPLRMADLAKAFFGWTDFLVHRYRVLRSIKGRTAYQMATTVGSLFDRILGRSFPLIGASRLSAFGRGKARKTAQGPQAEKQNLEQTAAFGHVLQDICDSLDGRTILNSPLPIRIELRGGKQIEHWSGFRNNLTGPSLAKALATYSSDQTLRNRRSVAMLRIEAELLMFIGQTGMNLQQAQLLKLRNFRFHQHIDGYQVRDYKARRGGDVEFEIFKSYRPHFERYLGWRRELFPSSQRLFPFVHVFGARDDSKHQFQLTKICKKLEIQYVGPRLLRGTRVNWCLRRSGDVNLSAEMAQHTAKTLLQAYERPSQQRAMTEVIQFWRQNDPSLLQQTHAVAPGDCNGSPKTLPETPAQATKPDCLRPSGCLWCTHHRDVDSFDYVWSLTSFAHLKQIELSKRLNSSASDEPTAADLAVHRIKGKLDWFALSNELRKGWVQEAHERIGEGNWHPDWSALIGHLEGL